MALILTLAEGDDFYVRDERFVLSRIHSHSDFVLLRPADRRKFRVVEGRSQEITPSVRISVGARGQLGLARVVLEAPRAIPIMRGVNYRRPATNAAPPPR